jgi:erythronate-4-phosphate dehydrogenase
MLAQAFKRLTHVKAATLAQQPKTVATLAAETLSELILASYDVAEDDLRMREALQASSNSSLTFDILRKQYPERHEFSCYEVSSTTENAQPELIDQALKLGFR